MCAEQQQITYVYAYIKAGRKFNNAISLLLSFNMKTELKYIYVTTSFAKWTHKFAEMLLLGSSAPQTPRYQSASGLRGQTWRGRIRGHTWRGIIQWHTWNGYNSRTDLEGQEFDDRPGGAEFEDVPEWAEFDAIWILLAPLWSKGQQFRYYWIRLWPKVSNLDIIVIQGSAI